MMENLLTASSDLIDTSTISSQSESRTSPVNLPEFDGETVLCRVCGDRASGFHYGVHACEGCKGFFRRSIQQKIQYRPCLKNQQCNIQRVNRNRCQYCRLKKCISVGMSRDAVRFGRVPKKEKARIIEQMQKKNMASQSSELNSLLANDIDVVAAVVTAHRHTCDISQFRAHQMRELALHNQEFINCPANMACPLNNEIGKDANANNSNMSDFSESFTPAIKSVVDFAKGIPGFILLNQDDQVTLLKAGTFEVLLVRLACLFDPNSNTMMFTGGKLYKRQLNSMTTNAGFLLDSMFDFADRFNKMCLIDDEIALFSAVVLMSPDRPGLRNVEQVERIQNKLTEALQNIINANHKEDGTLFAKLLMKTTDLRTLNTLHSEKSIAGQRSNHDRRERLTAEDMDVDFQDSISTRSGRSSPTLSETSNMTMTSGYSGETDSSNVVVGQRLPLEASSHQQVVLRTPYGTFYREEMSGFYGMMADQPRRRCNTLDRDTLTRPRLHTIEEGNRRRYTLDRDYINKMVNRLNDRLETRGPIRGSDPIIPPPMTNSTTSSPIQEEGNTLYPPPQHTVPHPVTFAPISGPEGSPVVSRTSPHVSTEALLAARAAGSSPGSPTSRSRSGSFNQDDYINARPRCYSFHLNSEGRAARMPALQHRLMAERGREDRDQISPENGQYLTPEMRRGSVGAAYGLHSRKQSLLVDRPLSYINRGGLEPDKRAHSHVAAMKHLLPDPSMYGHQLTPDLSAQRSALWHQQAAMAMGMAPPMTMPLMQRSREDLSHPIDSRAREWEAAKTQTRELPREVPPQDLNRAAIVASMKCPMSASETTGSAEYYKMLNAEKQEVKAGEERERLSALASMGSGLCTPVVMPPNVPKVTLSSDAGPTEMVSNPSNGSTYRPSRNGGQKTSTPETRTGLERNSPVEEMAVETFGHKKFDRFRKDKGQTESTASTLTVDIQKVKEEKMEEEDQKEDVQEEGELKTNRLSGFKVEQQEVGSSPASPHSSCASPSGDRQKISAKDAHPNLLAHLLNGGGSSKSRSSASSSTCSSPALSSSPLQQPSLPVPNSNPGVLWSSSSGAQPFRQASESIPDPANLSSHSPASNSVSPNNLSVNGSSLGGDSNKATNSKEEFHATAVSHLKDKLLRKYDSLENLAKVTKEPSMDSELSQNGHNSSAVRTTMTSTAELNKELATKLTLSPSTIPSATITKSTMAASGTQMVSASSLSPQSFATSGIPTSSMAPSLPSHILQHPTAAMSHMLLSQGLPPHPAMYHSMMNRHYPSLATAGASNPSQMPPLANMQQFAQMISRTPTMQAGSEKGERRMDFGSPLNLTSRMEDGSSSPSHSPQTPA